MDTRAITAALLAVAPFVLLPPMASASDTCPTGPVEFSAPEPVAASNVDDVFEDLQPAGDVVLADLNDGVISQLAILEPRDPLWFVRVASSPGLTGKAWMKFAAVPDGESLVAAVEHQVEGPGWEVIMLRSPDGGNSWDVVACIEKPKFEGLVDRLDMTSARVGSLTLTLDVGGARDGTYTSSTKDGGRTWSNFKRIGDVAPDPSFQQTAPGRSPEHRR